MQTEACWLLAFLTAKDDDTVAALMGQGLVEVTPSTLTISQSATRLSVCLPVRLPHSCPFIVGSIHHHRMGGRFLDLNNESLNVIPHFTSFRLPTNCPPSVLPGDGGYCLYLQSL